MGLQLRGAVVAITGASSGVGRALARAFGEQGARVALLARNARALEAAAREVEQAGGQGWALPLDVSDAPAVDAAAEQIVRRWGALDVWVNNAMVSVVSPALEMSAEEFRRVTEVTYLGYVHGTLAAVRQMRERGGTVLQIGSALTYRSIPLQSAYCAAKAAVRGFTDSLRTELLHDRIPVKLCSVQLPAINTPQFEAVRTRMPGHPMPVPPVFQPEVVARAVVRAARHPRRELWLGWPTLLAITAQQWVPGLADRFLARTGYRSQQLSEPVEPGREDNLFHPVKRDLGAHGRFDRESGDHSPQMWLDVHRGWALVAVAGLSLLALRSAR